MKRIWRSLFIVLIVTALAASMAACGKEAADTTDDGSDQGGGGGGGTEVALAAAVDALEDQQTVKMDFSVSFEGLGKEAEQGLAMLGGSLDMSGHVEMDMDSGLQSMVMEVPMLGEMEMIQDGETVYMKTPAGLGMGSKPWMSFDAGSEAASGLTGSMGGQSDPTAMLESLRGVSSGVEEVGTETIDGVETTHYAATIDLEKAMSMAPADQQAEMQASLGDLGIKEMPVDVWVDGDGLVRRMEIRMEMGKIAESAAGGDPTAAQMFKDATMVMTMDLYDYGVPVNIQVPPASQVQDVGDLGGLGGGDFGADIGGGLTG